MAWREIPGWEGWYEISDTGQVRSMDRRVPDRWGTDRFYHSRPKKLTIDPNGRPRVKLNRPGKHDLRFVHHLVLEAFVGPCPDGQECRHLNDVKTDNRLENLAWGTREENCKDLVRNDKRKGQSHKLTAFQAFMIRETPNRPRVALDLAEAMGVSVSTIGCIRAGQNWGWL